MSNAFADLYGRVAENYVARPHYPDELFSWLAANSPSTKLVWDCGCGSGQASADLARYFDKVIATDASQEQIGRANKTDRVHYLVANAESSGLPDKSADLIFVGMAAHWFNLPLFYSEARRILKPGGTLALVVYGEPNVDNRVVNPRVHEFFDRLDGYGPSERYQVKTLYQNLHFPFPNEIEMPPMNMRAEMGIQPLMQYFRSRSTVIDYTQKRQSDPVKALETILYELLDEPEKPLRINWPLSGRVARIR